MSKQCLRQGCCELRRSLKFVLEEQQKLRLDAIDLAKFVDECASDRYGGRRQLLMRKAAAVLDGMIAVKVE